MSKNEKKERQEILALIRNVLYDGDWISSDEIECIGEKTLTRDVVISDFSGHCMTDIIGCLEQTFGISLDDTRIKKSETFGDIVSIVFQEIICNIA